MGLWNPLSTTYLKPDACLRYPIYDTNGVMLLSPGSAITPRLRTLLTRRGVKLELCAVLEVVKGKPLGLEIPVTGDWLSIGRHRDCKVRPNCKLVSSRHCLIHKRSYGVYLKDLKSTNGTYVNDEKIEGEVELSDGDVVRLGNMEFVTQIFAAVAADNEEDQKALEAWILAEPFKDGPPSEPASGATVLANQAGDQAAPS